MNANGLQELLDDPAVISAIDEETEFNALVVRTEHDERTFKIGGICFKVMLNIITDDVWAGGRGGSSGITAWGKNLKFS